MCLLTVDEKPARKFGVGYKLVRERHDGSYECFDHRPHAGTVTYPLNQWITDPNDGDAGLSMEAYTPYRTGFHISLDEAPLRLLVSYKDVLIKVRFRKVTATSCERPDSCYGRQVVAREIMNLGEV